jgi:type IV pilus assembly protein PilC
MTIFVYKVRDMVGRNLSGTIDAENEKAVVEYLRSRDYLIVDISKQRIRNIEIKIPKLYPKVKSKDLAIFCRQFSTLLEAGVPILNCMSVLQEQSTHKLLKETLSKVIVNLEEGSSFTNSIRPFPKVFPDILISMVETGEVGGTLDEVMKRLAVGFEREHEITEKVKSAMTYPMTIIVVATISIIFLLVFMMPKIIGMVAQTGVELPLLTKIVLGISNIIKKSWWIILALLTGAFLTLKKAAGRKNMKEIYDSLILRIPIFGNLFRKMIVCQFSRSLGTMLRSGVPIIEALDTVRRTVGNQVVSKGVENARANIIRGQGIAEPMRESGIFPPMALEMMAVGEETGALDTLLEKIAVFYDQEVDHMLSRLSTMVEPIMIVGLGVVLGFIIIAMMLPIFQVMTNVPK